MCPSKCANNAYRMELKEICDITVSREHFYDGFGLFPVSETWEAIGPWPLCNLLQPL